MSQIPPLPHAGTTVAGQRLAPEVMQSLRDAAEKTGVDFDFLVAQASLESGFRGSVHATKGSASGLFQFTGGTWLQMMHDYGAKYGHADLARQIKPSPHGGLTVSSKATEQHILALRKDDGLSALFGAEYAKQNGVRLEAATGHKPSAPELHLAHLLGPAGAIRFLKAHDANEKQSAAKVVPSAARENPGLFYARGSRTSQSVAAVYQKIQERLDVPMQQMAEIDSQPLRPALGLSDTPPQTRTDRRA